MWHRAVFYNAYLKVGHIQHRILDHSCGLVEMGTNNKFGWIKHLIKVGPEGGLVFKRRSSGPAQGVSEGLWCRSVMILLKFSSKYIVLVFFNIILDFKSHSDFQSVRPVCFLHE